MFIDLLAKESESRITNLHFLNRLLKILAWCHLHPNKLGVKHHILPKCKSWFPEYAKNNKNIVKISNRMHFLIHHLMWKAFPKDKAMYTACWNMSHLNKNVKLSAKQYATIRKLHSDNMRLNNPAKRPGAMDLYKGDGNPAKRPDVRKKISDAQKGRIVSDEQKQKQSAKMIGRFTGDLNSSKRADVRKKISDALKGKSKSQEHIRKMSIATKNAFKTCRYCGTYTSAGNITRWHNNNCKLCTQDM
jgi:hypothetical protein